MVYPINQQIEELLNSAVDEETGEVLFTEEELEEKLQSLQMDFDEKIKALRNSYLATRIDAECVAAEASALYKLQQESSKRAKALENRAERTKRFIAWLLQGDSFQKDGVRISYITRQDTVIEDGFLDWAKHNAPGFLNEPTIRRADLNAALKSGQRIEYAHQEPKKYIQIK